MEGAMWKRRPLAWLALGLLVLTNAGCLVAAVGAGAAGAAAAGYTWYNGLLYRDYPANVADSLAAVRASLQELQFPLVTEKTDTGTAYVVTRTGDNHTVRIYLDIVASPIPAEGALTRIAVRVGFTGDEAVSARILDQVSRHLPSRSLAPASSAPLPTAPPAAPTLLPPRPVPVTETGPPPLATAPASATSPR